MGTLFVQQGTLMAREVSFNGQSFTIPSASMSTFNTLSIIVLIWWVAPGRLSFCFPSPPLLAGFLGCVVRWERSAYGPSLNSLPRKCTDPLVIKPSL